MFPMLANLAQFAVSGLNLVIAAIPLGIKSIKYFIDSTLRDHVQPMPGSVLYCDLWVAVEHSGIYVGNGKIANIVVDGAATATVERCGPQSFTSKSMLGRKIYVSCNQNGAVGLPVQQYLHALAAVGNGFYPQLAPAARRNVAPCARAILPCAALMRKTSPSVMRR